MTVTRSEQTRSELPRGGGDPRFEIRLSPIEGGMHARILGPLDLHHAPDLLVRLEDHLTTGKLLVVDLHQADFVDSSGIRALLLLQKNLDAAHGHLHLVIRPGSRVERVIGLLQLETHFRIFANRSDALLPSWVRS
jgi:anti-anti-sigma factor